MLFRSRAPQNLVAAALDEGAKDMPGRREVVRAIGIDAGRPAPTEAQRETVPALVLQEIGRREQAFAG